MTWLSLLFAALIAGVPKETPQPNNSGRLAGRTFEVRTPLGRGVARYFGSGSLDGDGGVTRALVIVHGVLRDADYYYDTGREAIAAAGAGHVLLIAPQFVEKDDFKGRVPRGALYWDSDWPGGADALAPARISSYDVFDAILARLSNRRRFPALREIVLAGHSAGGQILQRYAAVGKASELGSSSPVAVHVVVANPSSYLYFTDWRPLPHPHCPDFNHWRYGIAGAPRYVGRTPLEYEAQYVLRHVTYLLGTVDVNPGEEDLDRSCGAEAQGPNRFVRGKNYVRYLRIRHPGGTCQDYSFVRGVGHENRRMFTSACGRAVLFGAALGACAAHG